MYDKDISEEKLTPRKHRKLIKKHRKTFNKMCKEFRIWDWEYTHNLIVFIIKWMRDFYILGPNGFYDEDWINDRREEFETILRYQKDYTEFDEASNKMFSLASEIIKTKTELNGRVLPAIKTEIRDEELEKKSLDFKNASEEAFLNFYRVLGDKIRNWWD